MTGDKRFGMIFWIHFFVGSVCLYDSLPLSTRRTSTVPYLRAYMYVHFYGGVTKKYLSKRTVHECITQIFQRIESIQIQIKYIAIACCTSHHIVPNLFSVLNMALSLRSEDCSTVSEASNLFSTEKGLLVLR